jgi:lipopolysaccharide transport system ATP-binding protein
MLEKGNGHANNPPDSNLVGEINHFAPDMSDIVIDIANLSKRYSLSHQHRPDSLKTWLRNMARRVTHDGELPKDEEFWALKDVSLQIRQGDCLALIGKNGSGKSTLLKVLSRIIPPTSGYIRVCGRVASLLEIGTGFHPELTGRENIYLNGAILGMRKAEIRKNFDEIVDFGCDEIIDIIRIAFSERF